jgi:MFS family permease
LVFLADPANVVPEGRNVKFSFGGEYGGLVLMVAEYAPAARRGFYAGFVPAGSPAGLFLAALAVLLVSAMPREAFLAWGWRLPGSTPHTASVPVLDRPG